MTGVGTMSNWTLFSNHGHVLFCLSRDPQARLRDVAADVGITERAVQKIVRDLQDAGMISVTKNGRRNSYRIHHKSSLRHDIEAGCTLKDLLKVVNKTITEKQTSTENRSSDKALAVKQQEPKSPPVKPDSPAVAPTKRSLQQDDKPIKKDASKGKGEKDSIQKKMERQQGSLF